MAPSCQELIVGSVQTRSANNQDGTPKLPARLLGRTQTLKALTAVSAANCVDLRSRLDHGSVGGVLHVSAARPGVGTSHGSISAVRAGLSPEMFRSRHLRVRLEFFRGWTWIQRFVAVAGDRSKCSAGPAQHWRCAMMALLVGYISSLTNRTSPCGAMDAQHWV